MKIPASSLARRNSPMLLAAVACDALRRACEAAGRKDLAVWVRGAKVVPGKATFLTGRSMANAQLATIAGEVATELATEMAPFCPAGPGGWKVVFL